MAKAVNIEECFEKFTDTFSPKIVGELNGQLIMVVRLEGDKVLPSSDGQGLLPL